MIFAFKISRFLARLTVPLLIAALLTGCKKFVDVGAPSTSINSENVYTSDATAIAALTGIYTVMSNTTVHQGGLTSTSLFPGLSSDEFTLYAALSEPGFNNYYANELTSQNDEGGFWDQIYPLIFDANSAIEGLSASGSELTPSVREQLMGEAKFVRAFCYFYLINLYGDVPLVIGTDYNVNRLLARTSVDSVYQQIISDLKDAQGLLVQGYVGGNLISQTVERTTPNKWAATALLARAYLYTSQWDSAMIQASAIINNGSLYSITGLDSAFLRNNNEAIWQLQSVSSSPTVNNPDAYFFILPATGPNLSTNPVYLSPFLLNSFEAGDLRRAHWIDSSIVGADTFYYPFKYKNISDNGDPTEYRTVFRLAEQYLIRAEAEAETGDLNDAATDLNIIRKRAGLGATLATDQAGLLSAILHERQVEFFTEWGHRWLDLKRTNAINGVMAIVCPFKGGIWKPTSQLYPIPFSSISSDPRLVQNPGYE